MAVTTNPAKPPAPAKSGRRGGRGSGGTQNLIHQLQELEAARKTSESLTAEAKILAILQAASSAAHNAAQAKYTKILKTGNPWLLNMNVKHEARRQRKLLDNVAQMIDHAGDAILAVMLRDQQILDNAKKAQGKGSAYDAAS